MLIVTHTQPTAKRSKLKRRIRLFRKIRISFVRWHRRVQLRDVREVRLSLLAHNFSEADAMLLCDYMLQWQLAGFPVRVQQLQEQRTNECVGYLSFYHEGRLEFRKGLKLATEYTETKSVVFLQADSKYQQWFSSTS